MCDVGLLKDCSFFDSWISAKTNIKVAWGYAFFRKHSALVSCDGFTVLEDVAEYFSAILSKQCAMVSIPESFPGEIFNTLHDAVYKTFLGEDALHNVEGCLLCSPIVNTGLAARKERSRSSGAARYTSMKRLLMEAFETAENVWSAFRCAALDV